MSQIVQFAEARPLILAGLRGFKTPEHWIKRTALLLFQDRNEALKNLANYMRRRTFDKGCLADRPVKRLDLVGMHASIGFQASTQKWDEETRVPGDGGNAT